MKVYFYVSGVTANSFYGIHIHNFGDVYNGAVGGHFNPFNVPHACPPGKKRKEKRKEKETTFQTRKKNFFYKINL